MSRSGVILPPEDDPDPTDRLPELDLASVDGSGDPLESTGSWTVDGGPAAVEEAARLEERLAERDAALSALGSRLEQRDLALAQLERELEQARAGFEQARQEAAAELGEQRASIGRLEDQLSDARETEHRLGRRGEELSGELAAAREARATAEEKLSGAEARLAELEALLAAATRETMSAVQRQEHDRLRERATALEQELAAAVAARSAADEARDALRRDLGRREAAADEAARELRERDLRIELLLERLRNAEARRRIVADMRHAGAPPPVQDDRLAALSRQLEEEKTARDRLEREVARLQSERFRPPAPARRRLLRLDPGHEAAFLLLPPRTTIGRTPDNDLQVRENYISRAHAVVKLGTENAIIEDLGSRNGVFVNDRRVGKELLHDGDVVVLGKARFRYEALPPQAE